MAHLPGVGWIERGSVSDDDDGVGSLVGGREQGGEEGSSHLDGGSGASATVGGECQGVLDLRRQPLLV